MVKNAQEPASRSFWYAFTAMSVLLTVILSIALIALSEALIGIRSIVIILATLPLIWALYSVRVRHRNAILLSAILSFVYFCAGVMAMTSSLNNTPLPLMLCLAVVMWFSGSMMILKK